MTKNETLQLIIVLVIAVFLIETLIPFVKGSEKPMIVLSGSMVPLFLPGDVVIIKSVDSNKLNVGDVATFQIPHAKPGTVYTHRIISITEGEGRLFQTKGDANNVEDQFKIPASNAIGKLIFVLPFLGYLPDMLHNNRIFFILIIMLPAGLLVIDEIRNLILYSNPTRARRVESERRKAARRTFYKIKGKQLAALLLISGFVFAGIITYNLGENGPMVLRSENKIDNSGFLPMVYVLTDDNSEQILNIHPWYGVISPANETRVTTTDNTAVQISSAPYILPIFWIIALAGINPYLPVVSEIVIYTSVFIIILFPFWYKKSIRGRHKKKIRLNRLILQWKRKLHLE